MTDRRLQYPATERNRDAILGVLRDILPPSGVVLEIASGSGEHAVHFANALPGLTFQPSDPEEAARHSIAAWTAETGLPNIRPPLELDVLKEPWPIAQADAILCINMIHISPWDATLSLMRNAGRILLSGAPLYLYGPYRQQGIATAESNEAFDVGLKSRNPQWGLRHLDDVAALAHEAGFSAPTVTPMPANNLSVAFRRV
jgi:SAM-dependent methyltransferase